MSEETAPIPSPLVGEGGSGAQRRGRVRESAQRPSADPIRRARKLRQAMGEPERRLWRALRETFPTGHFRRQVPFGRYHADFCSHGHKLIVEVDGDDHAIREQQDAARTRFLEQQGYQVIRFANTDVMQKVDGICTVIAAALAQTGKGRP